MLEQRWQQARARGEPSTADSPESDTSLRVVARRTATVRTSCRGATDSCTSPPKVRRPSSTRRGSDLRVSSALTHRQARRRRPQRSRPRPRRRRRWQLRRPRSPRASSHRIPGLRARTERCAVDTTSGRRHDLDRFAGSLPAGNWQEDGSGSSARPTASQFCLRRGPLVHHARRRCDLDPLSTRRSRSTFDLAILNGTIYAVGLPVTNTAGSFGHLVDTGRASRLEARTRSRSRSVQVRFRPPQDRVVRQPAAWIVENDNRTRHHAGARLGNRNGSRARVDAPVFQTRTAPRTLAASTAHRRSSRACDEGACGDPRPQARRRRTTVEVSDNGGNTFASRTAPGYGLDRRCDSRRYRGHRRERRSDPSARPDDGATWSIVVGTYDGATMVATRPTSASRADARFHRRRRQGPMLMTHDGQAQHGPRSDSAVRITPRESACALSCSRSLRRCRAVQSSHCQRPASTSDDVDPASGRRPLKPVQAAPLRTTTSAPAATSAPAVSATFVSAGRGATRFRAERARRLPDERQPARRGRSRARYRPWDWQGGPHPLHRCVRRLRVPSRLRARC